ncbi:MAG: hypothetical protein ACTIN1_00005 [Pseudolactococcus laudensis]
MAGASNLNITFRNIKYGNDAYPNNNYYGILYIGGSYNNINFVVENVDYNIQTGAQPFYANGQTNTLTFKGKNNFKAVTSNGASGEFAEGFTSINFSDDSQTTIYNDTAAATALFWGPANQVITVGQNALVDISTSKEYLSYNGNLTLKVLENGLFKYRAISGTSHSMQTAALKAVGTIAMEFSQDSIGHFTIDKNGFSGPNPTISVNSPNYILFDASSSNKAVLSGLVPKFVRKDTDGNNYPINYLTKTGQAELTPNVTPSQTVSVSNANIKSGYSVAYTRAPRIMQLSGIPETGTDVSKVSAQVAQWTPENMGAGTKVSYKLARNKLYTQSDISDSAAQSSINNDTTVPTQIQDVTTNIATDSYYEYSNLSPQTYYLYSKIEDFHVAGYTLSSPWVEQALEVKPYIEISLPDALTFQSPKAGAIMTDTQLTDNLVVNHGNVPVNLDLKSLTVKADSSSKVSLVSKVQGKKQLHLQLVSQSLSGNGNSVIWNPLLVGPFSGQSIRLTPYWEDGQKASLSLSGEHSVSILDGGPYQVNYGLNVAVSQAT